MPSNSKTEIRRGRLTDVYFLLGNLRQADREEIMASTGEDPDKALAKAWDRSEYRRTIVVDGKPEAVFGVSRALKNVGVPWLLGTDKLPSVVFVRQGKEEISMMGQEYPFMLNYVDARNLKSVRWLRHCGFVLEDAVPYGKEKLPFHLFTKGRVQCVIQ